MTPAYQDALTDLHLGDCAEVLRALPVESVHCVVTSPPYFGGIRSYRGLGAEQLGHEATPEEYVERIVGIFREVRRVLRDDGLLALNLGDVYTGGGGFYPNAPANRNGSIQGQRNAHGLSNEKTERLDGGVGDGQLVGIPFRVVLALQVDGWRWRDTVIWHKLAPMPESISGTAWVRHYVTMTHYEKVQGLRHRSGNQDEHPIVRRLQTSTEGSAKPGIQTDRVLQSEGEREGAQTSSSPTQPQSEGQVPGDGEGSRCRQSQRITPGEVSASQRSIGKAAGSDATRSSDCGTLADDSRATQGALPLLSQTAQADNGPRSSIIQRGTALTGEHSPSVQELQQQQAPIRMASNLILCPGCPTCAPNDGLVLRRGQGRTTKAHEYLFMLAKGDRYYYDNEAVREKADAPELEYKAGRRSNAPESYGMNGIGWKGGFSPPGGRNRRSVWSLAPEPQGDALCAGCRTYYETRPKGKCPRCGGADFVSHYAAFPTALVEPCIMAGTSARGCCPTCAAPWARIIDRKPGLIRGGMFQDETRGHEPSERIRESGESTTLGFRATCRCDAGEPIPCTVLDCFSGSGTTSIVARRLGRRSIGVELAPDYLELSVHRLRAAQPGMALGV